MTDFEIIFPYNWGYGPLARKELRKSGYTDLLKVKYGEEVFRVCFATPDYIQQLSNQFAAGKKSYFAPRNLIVLEDITLTGILECLKGMDVAWFRDGFRERHRDGGDLLREP